MCCCGDPKVIDIPSTYISSIPLVDLELNAFGVPFWYDLV